jgi:hypothetical protein
MSRDEIMQKRKRGIILLVVFGVLRPGVAGVVLYKRAG